MRLSAVAASDTSSALVGSSHSNSAGGTMIAPCDRGALALTARELRRLRLGDFGGKSDERERLRDPLRARVPADALVVQALADELTDGHPRRERRARVLEHDLRTGAFADDHLTAVGLQESGDDAQQGRLPAARLADQRDRSAADDFEVDAAQRVQLLRRSRPPRSVNDFVTP